MELLERLPGGGHPAEYLLSRVRGKKTLLIGDWRRLIGADLLPLLSSSRYRGFVSEKSPEGMWRYLVAEYRWVYSQMDEPLREVFRHFFLYAELRTLFICLRHIREGKIGGLGELLAMSLLSKKMKTVLSTSKDISSCLRFVERSFISLSTGFEGVVEPYEAEGLRGVERALTDRYLTHVMGEDLHPLIRDFFLRVIDSRNVTSLVKYLKLGKKTAPSFIPHGTVSERQLREILETDDINRITFLIRKTAGVTIEEPEPSAVEHAFYRGMTKFLARAARDPLGIGPILDYLWRCSVEVMNLGIILYGVNVDHGMIEAELVR